MLKLTLELDFDSEEKLHDSYLWNRLLSNAIASNKCISFRVDTPDNEKED